VTLALSVAMVRKLSDVYGGRGASGQ